MSEAQGSGQIFCDDHGCRPVRRGCHLDNNAFLARKLTGGINEVSKQNLPGKAGIAMIALPGPGWLTIAAGLAILAGEYAWARRLLDRLKHHARHIRR